MEDDRLRIPIDDPYLHAVGLALICFARLEWSAVWCCQKLQPGYVDGVATKTAGVIAKDFIALCAAEPGTSIAEPLGKASTDFLRLVELRNGLVHSNPATAKDGSQRLFRNGREWTIAMVDELADEFAAAEIQLDKLRS